MNIIPLHNPPRPQPIETGALYSRMESSLKTANASFEKSIRMAKTLAPILSDQTSNARHLETIESSAPAEDKVIAILMLGFPKNRALLPILQNILRTGPQALRMAAAIAISQMRDGNNNSILTDILLSALRTESERDVKKTIRQVIMTLIDRKTASLLKDIAED